jgi:macrolide transport system ATP-binding/permease protein
VGKTITIERSHFRVIGLMPAKGSAGFSDPDDIVVMPVSTAQFRMFGDRYLHGIDVEVEDSSLVDKAIDDITNLLRTIHRVPASKKDTLDIRNLTEIREMLSATTKIMGWLLGSIAMISLLVGGIGIMNIMLVSVTERTREIGLRKALGAANRDILRQFLVESVVMSVGGGLLGVVLGIGGALGLFALKELPFAISTVSILLTLALSIIAGLLFGLWPARKASQLDPIEALRYE